MDVKGRGRDVIEVQSSHVTAGAHTNINNPVGIVCPTVETGTGHTPEHNSDA